MKVMKFSFFFLFIAICCAVNANEKTIHTLASNITKTYIDPNNIQFDNNNIYVCVNQNWVQTNAVCKDEQGLYIIDEQGAWKCSYCKQWTDSNPWTCDFCGRRRE